MQALDVRWYSHPLLGTTIRQVTKTRQHIHKIFASKALSVQQASLPAVPPSSPLIDRNLYAQSFPHRRMYLHGVRALLPLSDKAAEENKGLIRREKSPIDEREREVRGKYTPSYIRGDLLP